MFNKYLQVLLMITLMKPYISVVVSLSRVWSHLILMPLIFAVIVKTKFSMFETLNSSSMIQFSNCLLKVKWYHLSLHHPINIFIVQPKLQIHILTYGNVSSCLFGWQTVLTSYHYRLCFWNPFSSFLFRRLSISLERKIPRSKLTLHYTAFWFGSYALIIFCGSNNISLPDIFLLFRNLKRKEERKKNKRKIKSLLVTGSRNSTTKFCQFQSRASTQNISFPFIYFYEKVDCFECF